MADQFSFLPGWLQSVIGGVAPQPLPGILGAYGGNQSVPGILNAYANPMTSGAPDLSNVGNPPAFPVLPAAGNSQTMSLMSWQGVTNGLSSMNVAPVAVSSGIQVSPTLDSNTAQQSAQASASPTARSVAEAIGTVEHIVGIKNGAIRSGLNAVAADPVLQVGFRDITEPISRGLMAIGAIPEIKADIDAGASPAAAFTGVIVRDGIIYGVTAAGNRIPIVGPLVGSSAGLALDKKLLPDSKTIGQSITGSIGALYNSLTGGNH
jgi:hypothetical protein